MVERGYQSGGLASWGELAAESHETNLDLVWPRSIDVFDKMRREDAQVGSVLRAVTTPIRSTAWMIDPAGARSDVVDLVARDLGVPVRGQGPVASVRTKGRFSWSEHLRLALLELVYGHSFFEQVYSADGELIHLAKLAWRPPRTISNINVARDGGLVSIQQYGVSGVPAPTIPVSHLVAYINEREGSNWLGQSLLRTAYKNWLLKDRMLRAQALTVERNGLGVPVYTGAEPPTSATLEERRKWEESEKSSGLDVATSFRAGEAAGASIPHGASLDLKGVTGDLPDIDAPIRYHDEQIARAVLAHFLNLGTETGSWALGSTFADFFTQSLNATARHIQDVTQQHVVEDLVDANWGSSEPAPRLVCEPIGARSPVTASAIKELVDAGALTPDPELEKYLREYYDLPVGQANAARTVLQKGGSLW
ncbi:phage portal protein family protein [Changpingibacter yushuensis]|uniref:phage portal protein family protein n=1 Tax=Changpingibacter yushuensis TaxID=2758440 RepID=UPI00165D5FFF|nr:hypothetical protein [Changpingibacter yushuensis]